MQCNELRKKKTKLAWGSYRTCAAMDRILLYSKTKSNEWIAVPWTAQFQNKFENHELKKNN